jgi:hypothetical protein
MPVLFMLTVFSVIVHIGRGGYSRSAPLLTGAFLVWAFSVIRGSRPSAQSKGYSRMLKWLPVVFLFFSAVRPNLSLPDDQASLVFCWIRWALFVAVSVLVGMPRLSLGMRFLGVSIAFLCLGISIPILTPDPFIDVFRSNKLGVEHFLAGRNPYSQVYPDIYGGIYDYQPGFLYWPGTLWVQTVSQLFTGDIRFIQILLWWLVPVMMYRHFRTEHSTRIGFIWWSLPFLPFGFSQAWIDPMLSFSLAMMLLSLAQGRSGCGAGRAGFWAGWGASIKQYGGIFGLFGMFHLGFSGSIKRALALAASGAIVVMMVFAPFLIWNAPALLEMTVSRHVLASIRMDALNFTAFYARIFGVPPPAFVQLGAVLVGLIGAVFHQWKSARKCGLRTIPESCAILFGFSMFFGKFAFCNYHWLLISFWLLAEWMKPASPRRPQDCEEGQ